MLLPVSKWMREQLENTELESLAFKLNPALTITFDVNIPW